MSSNKTGAIVFTAVMTALTTVFTLISIPLASGYYNFGDIAIFMSSALLGPLCGAIVGGLGAALGDVCLGYLIYTPFTLAIKALEGLISGLLFNILRRFVLQKKGLCATLHFFVCALSGLVMALGYFIAEGLLLSEDKWTGGIANLPFNILQGTISAALAVILLYLCRVNYIFEKFYQLKPLKDKIKKQNNSDKSNDGNDREI